VARRLPYAAARERAVAALRRVGLDRAVDQFPHTLSGGMKQRAAIARALATEPDVLLMDEPFAALDALTRQQMQRDLIGIAEETGITLLFVTHAIDEAVLIGTHLHLLSAHPGRTIDTFATGGFGIGDLGSARFETMVREINARLFAPEAAS
jgi:NitT/TauT family transport system ATP-binding protein